MKGEALQFPMNCHVCFKEGYNRMCEVSVPFFKSLIIMAFSCDHCGCHNSEIKTGGEIGDKGKKFTLNANCEDDLKRDVFKSESARVLIPECDLELDYGTLGGKYTTVEGLLENIIDNFQKNNPFRGDSDKEISARIDAFFFKMNEFKDNNKPFTLIIDDPLDNSFI